MPFILLALGWCRSAFSAVLTVFSKPPGSWIAAAVAFALGLWWFGQHEYNKGRNDELERQADAAVHIQDAQRKITFDVGMKFEAVKLANTQATAKRVEEVTVHVTKKADAACPVPVGFVRVFNDAAHGPVPDPSAGPDDAPSGVALSDVAKTTVENFGIYDQAADQLRALQDWVRQQQKANP